MKWSKRANTSQMSKPATEKEDEIDLEASVTQSSVKNRQKIDFDFDDIDMLEKIANQNRNMMNDIIRTTKDKTEDEKSSKISF